jgi:hypothetical protein
MNLNLPYFQFGSVDDGTPKPIAYFQPDGSVKLLQDVFDSIPGKRIDIKSDSGLKSKRFHIVTFFPGLIYNKVFYGTESPKEYTVYEKLLSDKEFVNAIDLVSQACAAMAKHPSNNFLKDMLSELGIKESATELPVAAEEQKVSVKKVTQKEEARILVTDGHGNESEEEIELLAEEQVSDASIEVPVAEEELVVNEQENSSDVCIEEVAGQTEEPTPDNTSVALQQCVADAENSYGESDEDELLQIKIKKIRLTIAYINSHFDSWQKIQELGFPKEAYENRFEYEEAVKVVSWVDSYIGGRDLTYPQLLQLIDLENA